MKYISLFSGVGGLESSDEGPLYLCDSDPDCAVVLARIYPKTPIYSDVHQLPKTRADVCLAGWPCQDITSAGRQAGMRGAHSSLLFQAINAAVIARVHTLVGENVPNLLRLRSGDEFRVVLDALSGAGFSYIAWRSLNAREFGLPQNRERIIIVASKIRNIAASLHRPIGATPPGSRQQRGRAAGFYWTGGLRSICYSDGFVPALKVGASPPKGGTSPVAVFYGNTVRKLSARESVALQGFDPRLFEGLIAGSVFRMAGNAVPRPMGIFAADSARLSEDVDAAFTRSESVNRHGLLAKGKLYDVRHAAVPLSKNLLSFLDNSSRDSLSNQAAAGLLARLIKSRKAIPIPLFDALYELSAVRTKLRGTKVDSFTILHEQLEPLKYRAALVGRQHMELELE
jgi:DNA (cytosine-5)-methyltransferase 1